MTGRAPRETRCAEVSMQVWLFLDHECDADRCALLQQHLGECDRCWAVFSVEAKLKELLAHACGNEHAPEELRARLRERILATVQAERRRGEPTPMHTDESDSNGSERMPRPNDAVAGMLRGVRGVARHLRR